MGSSWSWGCWRGRGCFPLSPLPPDVPSPASGLGSCPHRLPAVARLDFSFFDELDAVFLKESVLLFLFFNLSYNRKVVPLATLLLTIV